jgi:uncharacterized protein (TIGR03083 family)
MMDETVQPGNGTAFDPFRRAVDAADRFANAVDALDDVDADRRVPTCPGWTIRDLVAHVSTVGGFYVEVINGHGRFGLEPREIDVINATNLARALDRSMSELADEIRAGTRSLADRLQTMRPDELVPYHAGSSLPPSQIMTLLHGDVLLHGYDLSRGTSARWRIPADEAVAAFDAFLPLSSRWVDPKAAAGHNATYEIRLWGGPTYRLAFRDGHATTDVAADERIHCHIAGDPAALLLVMFRRITAIRAAATGRSFAWGRRPWLAFTFTGRFQPI